MRYRVLGTLLLASLGTLAIVEIGAWVVLEQILAEKVKEHMVTVVQDHAAAVELFLDERLMALTLVARLHSREELIQPGALQRVLTDLNTSYIDSYQDLGIIDQEGQHLAYVGPYDLLGKNYRNAPWFENVKNQDHYISEVFLGFRNIPHFIMAVRRDEIGGHFWILRASINTDIFERVLARGRLGSTGDCFVLDRHARYQTSPKENARPLDASPITIPELTDQVMTVRATGPGGREITRTLKWIKQQQWLLVVQQEKEETLAPIYRARRNGLIVGGVGAFVITVTMLWTTRMLFRRLARTQLQKDTLNSQLLQASKLATIGEMTTGVAHEINNPLAIILSEQTNIFDLLGELNSEDERVLEMKASVDQTCKQVLRCKAITQKMLQFGRQQTVEGKRVDLARELSEIVKLVGHQAQIANADLCLEIENDVPSIVIDPAELQQIMTNLVNNSLQAMQRAGGGILVSVWRQGRGATIMVEDTGPGIAPDILERVFEPFFTTKPVGQGTGLGLSVCYGIVTKWRGKIWAECSPRGGAAFYMTFPQAPDADRA
jgi:two-component system NtrC family sensor kinase